jgi:hypothetical protein
VISFEWKDLAWILGVSGIIGGVLLAFLRFKLAGDFAAKSDVSVLTGRITAMENRLATMPNHEDLRVMQARMGGLEREVAVVGERLGGVTEILKRVEHQTQLLVHHQIREGER